MQNRSITPDTHKSRTMIKDEEGLNLFVDNLKNQKHILDTLKDNLEEVKQSDQPEFITQQKNDEETSSLSLMGQFASDQKLEVQEEEKNDESEQIQKISKTIEQTISSDNYLYYVDEYQYKDSHKSHVLHFGINAYSNYLIEKIVKYKNQSALEPGKSGKKSAISDLLQDILSKNGTEFETNNTIEAISYLDSNKASTVLVDVFVRNSSNNINFINDIPEVHTVVMYKQLSSNNGKDQYCVLDPNNPSFSYILYSIGSSLKREILVCPNEKLKIYQRNGESGSNASEWRDCIDISVKLAFNLENNKIFLETAKDGKFRYINYESLKNCISVKDITNQAGVYDKLPKVVEKEPTREKQSSDVKVQSHTTFQLKLLDLKIIKNIASSELDPYNYRDIVDFSIQKLLNSENQVEKIKQLILTYQAHQEKYSFEALEERAINFIGDTYDEFNTFLTGNSNTSGDI